MRTERDVKKQLSLYWDEDFQIRFRITYEEERESLLNIAADKLRKRGWPEAEITDLIQAVREVCDPQTALKQRAKKALRDYHAFLREKMYQIDYAEQLNSGYVEGYRLGFELGRIEERNRIANNMRKLGISEEMIAHAIATD